MVSIGAPNALETRLSELAGFGMGRPVNVLFSEYVTVLVARGVIDTATAEQLSIGFYAARYGDLNTEDLRVREAIVRLEDVITRLAAMPVDARVELSERVQRDLRTISENVARSAVAKVPIAPVPAWNAPPLAAAVGLLDAEPSNEFADNEFADKGPLLSVAVPSVDSPSNRRRRRHLNLLVLAAFGLFFAGYASYRPIEKVIQRYANDDVAPPHATRERPKVVEKQPPKERQPSKEELLRNWAVAEARMQQDQKAGMAYELLLAYQPDDALTLNNLAWLYLTTNDPAVHNPKRGLELAIHAIRLRRAVEFLDTAAEAHFQTGNPQEAVKLEKEALQKSQKPALFQRGYESVFRQQLQKFEAACKPRPPSSSTPSPSPAPKKAPARTPTKS
jgi:tetratricopeptide (TPR) repeat protein